MKAKLSYQKNKACPLLWNHSYIGTTGQVKPCCRSQHEHLSNSWNNAVFIDGVMSKAHIQARQIMRENKWPSACNICNIHEKKFGTSARLQFLETYDIDFSQEPTNNNIESIDVKFNNTCNLACVMCNSSSSSKINDLVKTNKNLCPTSMGRHLDIDWQEDKKLAWCKQIISNGNLKLLKTTGGEPFAQKHFWQLIDWCIEKNYTKFQINITTNGTKLNKKFLDKLVRFKKVQLCISCDGTKDVYNFIRQGTTWDQFTQNAKSIQSYVSKFHNIFLQPNLHCVLQAYNYYDIENLYDFAVAHNFKFTIDCFLNPLDSELSIESIPIKARKRFIKNSKLKHIDNAAVQKYVKRMLTAPFDVNKAQKLAKTTQNLAILYN